MRVHSITQYLSCATVISLLSVYQLAFVKGSPTCDKDYYFNSTANSCYRCSPCNQTGLWHGQHIPKCKRNLGCPHWCPATYEYDEGLPESEWANCSVPEPSPTTMPISTSGWISSTTELTPTNGSILMFVNASVGIQTQVTSKPTEEPKSNRTSPQVLVGLPNITKATPSEDVGKLHQLNNILDQAFLFVATILVFVVITFCGMRKFNRGRKLPPSSYFEQCQVSVTSNDWCVMVITVEPTKYGVKKRNISVEWGDGETSVFQKYSKNDHSAQFKGLTPGGSYSFWGILDGVKFQFGSYKCKGPDLSLSEDAHVSGQCNVSVSDWNEQFLGCLNFYIPGQPQFNRTLKIDRNADFHCDKLLPNMEYKVNLSFLLRDGQRIGSLSMPSMKTRVKGNRLQFPKFSDVESLSLKGCNCFETQTINLTDENPYSVSLDQLPKESSFDLCWTSTGAAKHLPSGNIKYESLPLEDGHINSRCSIPTEIILNQQTVMFDLNRLVPPSSSSNETVARRAFLSVLKCEDLNRDILLSREEFISDLFETQSANGCLEGVTVYELVLHLFRELKICHEEEREKDASQISECLLILQQFHEKSNKNCVCAGVFKAFEHLRNCSGDISVSSLDKGIHSSADTGFESDELSSGNTETSHCDRYTLCDKIWSKFQGLRTVSSKRINFGGGHNNDSCSQESWSNVQDGDSLESFHGTNSDHQDLFSEEIATVEQKNSNENDGTCHLNAAFLK